MKGLFSMNGRYNRAKYFWTTVLLAIVMNALCFGLGLALGSAGVHDPVTAAALSLIFTIPGVVLIAFQAVKRFHDLNRPGTHYWLLLIPFYGIPYLALVLLFKKGTVGANAYGPDPLAGR
jgi:uncharacterized membrane protein YhaH (DUF805 family)